MKVQQGNMLASLENTRRFLDDNKAALVGVITGGTQQKLENSIAELSSTVTEQNQYTLDRSGSFAIQVASRAALLRDHMAPIVKIARLELSRAPELVKLSLPRKKISIQQLGALADGMAEAARPHAQVFIDAGRKPDFLDRLKTAADQMRSAAYDSAQGRVRIKKATSSLAEKLSHARKVVHVLDALVKEAAASDKALLDSWNIAKRVVRTNGISRSTTPAGSSPAATTLTATTPATTITTAAASFTTYRLRNCTMRRTSSTPRRPNVWVVTPPEHGVERPPRFLALAPVALSVGCQLGTGNSGCTVQIGTALTVGGRE